MHPLDDLLFCCQFNPIFIPTMRNQIDQAIRVLTLGAGVVGFLLFVVFRFL